ncbi:1-acyl-sn-glycerol-3-phosphate acyltransferase [Lacinutrix jangbogonensis]|uniref:1-acyl-sn-glycerol-3-phosphate acyltransferase n=1 Tax=Lacinutrix jangbogonensis TaxID=1469557 RepID=UPI000AA1140B|nr:1-acyl-sn-glycerol-3-phosphate acyltransferase [Lacinutrix jangbogonensis]
MKSLLIFCVKTYIGIGLFFYFKKIEIKKHAPIPKGKPILFLGNHQNALLDPLIMAVTSGRYAHFLTRAQVFKKPLVGKILKALQLIPVYRVRDGWQNIKENNAIFSQCISLLNNNDAITIFPEGSHNLKRTVRPLSKGFTRIVLGVLEENPTSELLLIPVGLNYKAAAACPDQAMVFFGKPISASKYINDTKNEAIINLKTDVHCVLTELTTHIETDSYNNTLSKLESLNVNFLEPQKVNACIKSNFENCETQPKTRSNHLKSFFKMLLIVICFVPYLVWKKIAQPKIKEIEFTSTFRFALAITLVPFWLLLIALIVSLVFSGSSAVYFMVSALIIALLAVKL